MTEQNPYAYGYARMPRPLHEHTCFLCKQVFTHTWKRKRQFCPECSTSPLCRIAYHLIGQLNRSEKAGLPATLTLEQWLYTISYFDGMCAYCQEIPYKCMDHFYPFDLGYGTTWNNVVPACHGCNHRKGSKLPEEILKPDELERVRTYLYMLPYEEVSA